MDQMERAANYMDAAAEKLELAAADCREEARWIRQDSSIGDDHRDSYAASSLASRLHTVSGFTKDAHELLGPK